MRTKRSSFAGTARDWLRDRRGRNGGGESDPSTGVAGGTRCFSVRAFDGPVVPAKKGKFLNWKKNIRGSAPIRNKEPLDRGRGTRWTRWIRTYFGRWAWEQMFLLRERGYVRIYKNLVLYFVTTIKRRPKRLSTILTD